MSPKWGPFSTLVRRPRRMVLMWRATNADDTNDKTMARFSGRGGKEKFVWLTWHLFWQVSFPLIVVKSANVPAMEN